VTIEVPTRKFTVDEYYKMADIGILSEDDRVELIEGIIVEMPPTGSDHADVVDALQEALSEGIGRAGRIRIQNPLRLSDDSEPVPDIVIADYRRYKAGHPRPEDVLLLIEVSDTARRYDRNTKIPLYAGAGIREVWLVDLTERRFHIFRAPVGGKFTETQVLARGESISPVAFAAVSIDITEILS
jgi:Uma2 family endonuclease